MFDTYLPEFISKKGMALFLGVATLLPFSGQAAAQDTQLASSSVSYRFDGAGRQVGEIKPDPDGTGSLQFLATRTVLEETGLPIRLESGVLSSWQPASTAPSSWPNFVIHKVERFYYDTLGKLVKSEVVDQNGQVVTVKQVSYDKLGRAACTAERMNPSIFTALPDSACALGLQGAQGPDRIIRNTYDAAGQLIQVRTGLGTAAESVDATIKYTPNGKRELVIDANGNKAQYTYDGFDRLAKWTFPSTTRPTAFNPVTQATAISTAGSVNASDYESYTYDANGNRTSLRKRDGSELTYEYDALNRMTRKIVPERAGLAATHTRDVYYGYDLRGLQLYARFDSASGEGVSNAWDGFGRQTSSTTNLDGQSRAVSWLYDANGNRTRMTFPDGNYVTYAYDGLDRPTAILRSGSGAIASYGYDAAGRRTSFNGAVNTSYGYDPAGRLASLANVPVGGSNANTYGFTWTPSNQIASLSKSNSAFVFSALYNVNRPYTANGLNQYTAAGAASFAYDANGNLTGDGANTFTYDVENRLVAASGQRTAAMRYDPLGRLYEIGGGSGVLRQLYDGDALVAEYDGGGALMRRYVHGADAKADDPIAWYEGATFSGTSERHLRPDWQGSVTLVTDSSGAMIAINRYDEYGIPQPGNAGRFQYIGQAWVPEIGMYYYKARFYSPTLGRFMQTDPIGYEDQWNLYGYVGNDPVNAVDPNGKETIFIGGGCDGYCPGQEIVKSYAQSIGAKFFTHLESLDISAALMRANSRGEPVVVIGHSMGGAEAIRRSAEGYNVDLLVTVDPVGSLSKRTMGKMEDFKGLWVDIRAAERTGQSASRGDKIARTGRSLFGKTQGSADVQLNTDLSHEQFPQMLDEARIPEMACAVDKSSGFCP